MGNENLRYTGTHISYWISQATFSTKDTTEVIMVSEYKALQNNFSKAYRYHWHENIHRSL